MAFQFAIQALKKNKNYNFVGAHSNQMCCTRLCGQLKDRRKKLFE